jgi:large subunit ribosomal protein LP0
MPNAEKLAKKQLYFEKLIDLCVNSPNALLVNVDYVASKQMSNIRVELRGKAIVLMGKNTMIRKALMIGHERHPEAGMDKLRAVMQGNRGFIFATHCTLDHIREVLAKHKRDSAAKAGQVAVVDWFVPSGPTGMDPSQTSFFQALNIGTKIVKGQIELVSDFKILTVGERVNASAAVLLSKLGIRPFEYKIEVQMVYQDASVFSAAVLDISESVLITKFLAGVANMAAFSREIGIPTEAGLPHMFGNAFKNVAALVADIDFTFKEVEDVKKFLADPDAYAAANPGAAAAPAAGGAAPAGKKEEKKAAVVEEEEEDLDFDLFG